MAFGICQYGADYYIVKVVLKGGIPDKDNRVIVRVSEARTH